VSYLTGDPAAANALIKRDNPDMDDAKIAYAIKAMKENGIVQSGDAATLGVGAMTDARWKSFYDAMVASGAVKGGLDLSRAYTLRFVNKRVGMG
jgi:NitT/TauT family transport system substrate-binding protein